MIINTVKKYFLENISLFIKINKELGECISSKKNFLIEIQLRKEHIKYL